MNLNTSKIKDLVVGIDFGTTYSLVSIVDNFKKKPKIICYNENKGFLPSIIHYSKNGKVQVGELAKKYQIIDPENTISSVKRLIVYNHKNLKIFNRSIHSLFDFKYNSNILNIKIGFGFKSIIEIISDIFKDIYRNISKIFYKKAFGAVITVPAYFNDIQRKIIKDSATIAKINVLKLINEPTSASIAYGVNNKLSGKYIIYDLGGGTFDVSILKIKNKVFRVLTTGGDLLLGGDDFDKLIFDWIYNKINLKLSIKNINIIMNKIKFSKESLFFLNFIKIKFLIFRKKFNFLLTRKKFKILTFKLFNRTIKIINKILYKSNISISKLNGIILVGGSTKIKYLRSELKFIFKKKIYFNINPDKVVSYGAAIHAYELIFNKYNILLLDVTPFSLGIEILGGMVEKIILKNSSLPCLKEKYFTTYIDNQKSILINVVQGESKYLKNCYSLLKFKLTGIPLLKAGILRIKVIFEIDTNFLLKVSVEENINKIRIENFVNSFLKLN